MAILTDCTSRFRWAVCQLESLRKCHTLNSLRRTLQDLPDGLYETYDRILLNVPKVHRVHVQRALIWLAFSREPMTLGQVAEAVLAGREQQFMDPGDQFRDVSDLLDLCSSFVCLAGPSPLGPLFELSRKQTDRTGIVSDAYLVLRLAHSSVKEYILTDRTKITTLIGHRLTSGTAQRFLAEVCLIHLNEFDKQRLVWDDIFQGHHFLIYTAWHWFLHYDEIPTEEEDSVVDLLLTFIDTFHNGYAYRNWFGLLHDWSKSDQQTIAPLVALSSLGAPRAVTALIENAAEAHVTDHMLRKGLTYASWGGHTAVVRVLLDAGARLNRVGVNDASSLRQALSEATTRGFTGVAELLISRGATAEGLDYRFVSGVAAREGKTHIVKLSLDCTISMCQKIKIFYGHFRRRY